MKRRITFRHRPCGAFTLTELLVAILIVCILAAIVFTGVRRATGAAQEAACVSNMRQLGQGVLLYAQDHGGRLPPVRDGYASEDRARTWMLYVCPYVGTEVYIGNSYERHMQKTIFWCPADRTEWLPSSYGGFNTLYATKNSYLANNAIMDELVQDVDGDGIIGPRFLSTVSNPSRTIMLMEGGWNKWNIVGFDSGAFSFFGRGRDGYQTNSDNEAGYHRGASNWVFADGHIARLRLADTYGPNFNYWLADK